jgi:hypothetical protein
VFTDFFQLPTGVLKYLYYYNEVLMGVLYNAVMGIQYNAVMGVLYNAVLTGLRPGT